jgi:hypothetical protein
MVAVFARFDRLEIVREGLGFEKGRRRKMSEHPNSASVADLSDALAGLDGSERKSYALQMPVGQFRDPCDARSVADSIAALDDSDLQKFTSNMSKAASSNALTEGSATANVFHRLLVLGGEEQDHRLRRQRDAGDPGIGGLMDAGVS